MLIIRLRGGGCNEDSGRKRNCFSRASPNVTARSSYRIHGTSERLDCWRIWDLKRWQPPAPDMRFRSAGAITPWAADRMISHVRDIVAATDLPVSADLENGFGDDPETAAETIRLGAAAGLVGGSIEDSNARRDDPIYELQHAADRVRAAADMAHSLPYPFTLTARAENYLFGRRDLNDTIKRLQTYQEAGADVLYAPGLSTKEDISAVVSSLDRPVNVLMGLKGVRLTMAELSQIGVKRISVGSVLSRVALSAFIRAAEEMRDHGTFSFGDDIVSFRDISAMFGDIK